MDLQLCGMIIKKKSTQKKEDDALDANILIVDDEQAIADLVEVKCTHRVGHKF